MQRDAISECSCNAVVMQVNACECKKCKKRNAWAKTTRIFGQEPHLCHQNRACKYYKLTSDNDGEAFRWTSNYQIISKVYLKKHSSLPLCYSLSAADKKMVTSTMKKMVGPEAE